MTDQQIRELYEQCYPKIARYIFQRDGSDEAAEECFQVAMEKLLLKSAIEAVENPEGYLFRVSWNAFLREQKRRGIFVQPRAGDPEADLEGDETETAPVRPQILAAGPADGEPNDWSNLVEVLWRFADELSRGDQEILELTFQRDPALEEAEIAALLKIGVDAVKVKRARAVEKLRINLFENGFGANFSRKKRAELIEKLAKRKS